MTTNNRRVISAKLDGELARAFFSKIALTRGWKKGIITQVITELIQQWVNQA